MAKSKWEGAEEKNGKAEGTYTPRYARAAPKFSPRKAIRSFRDLDVYRRVMECAVAVEREILPQDSAAAFQHKEGMRNCALTVPLLISEAHGMRFENFEGGLMTLERAMRGCNKMVVYLELFAGTVESADVARIEELSGSYIDTRGKMLRLGSSWKKYRATKL